MFASSSSAAPCCSRPCHVIASTTRGMSQHPRLHLAAPRRVPPCAAHPPNHGSQQGASFDSEDELDTSLTAELEGIINPSKAVKMANHLDLLWNIGKKQRRPEACACCTGSGDRECNFCHGTGVLTVGDSIISSTATQKSCCPVCKGEGYTPCSHCRGTGYRAEWLGGNTSCEIR